MLHTHAECNLSFACKGKALQANKGTKSQNLHHPFLILVITLSNTPPLAPIVSDQDNKTLPQFQETSHSVLCLCNPLLCLFANLNMSDV